MFGATGFSKTPSTFGGGLFGKSTGGGDGGFGTTGTGSSVFGGGASLQPQQQQQNMSVFGGQQQQQQQQSVFGGGGGVGSGFGIGGQAASPLSSVFGGSPNLSTSTSSSAFGPFSGQGQQLTTGTPIRFKAVKSAVTASRGGSVVNETYQCITIMKQYETKSLEELRFEDYQLNRKGRQNLTGVFGGGGGGGSVQQQSGGTFGQPQASLFGQTQSSGGGGLFGFGTGGTGIQPPNLSGGLFGNSTPPTSTATTGSTGFLFNSSATSQQPAQATAFGFGTSNNNAVVSSTAAPEGGQGFGATSIFSFPKPQQGLLSGFGQQPAATTATTASLFGGGGVGNTGINFQKSVVDGGSTTGTGPFNFGSTGTGAAATPLFGTAGVVTGNTQQKQQSKHVTFNLPPAQSTTQSTTFGATNAFNVSNPPTTDFRTAGTVSAASGSSTTGGSSSFSFGPPANISFGLGTTGNSSTSSWFGSGSGKSLVSGGFQFQPRQPVYAPQHQQGSSRFPVGNVAKPHHRIDQLLYSLIGNRNVEDMAKPTSPLAQLKYLPVRSKGSSGISAKGATIANGDFRPPPPSQAQSPSTPSSISRKSFRTTTITKFDVFNGPDADAEGDNTMRFDKNVKRLMLPQCNPTTKVSHWPPKTADTNDSLYRMGAWRKPRIGFNSTFLNTDDISVSFLIGGQNQTPTDDLGISTILESTTGDDGGHTSASNQDLECVIGAVGNNGVANGSAAAVVVARPRPDPGSVCGVICTRPGYYVQPSLEELDQMTDENGDCWVKEGFEVGRRHFGRVRFLEPVNVAKSNIDDIFLFQHKQVIVYDDESKKPPPGQSLNCSAEIELERVWPIDQVSKEAVRSPTQIKALKFESKLRRACVRLGVTFVSYDDITGIWKFRVNNFS